MSGSGAARQRFSRATSSCATYALEDEMLVHSELSQDFVETGDARGARNYIDVRSEAIIETAETDDIEVETTTTSATGTTSTTPGETTATATGETTATTIDEAHPEATNDSIPATSPPLLPQPQSEPDGSLDQDGPDGQDGLMDVESIDPA